MFIKTLYLKNTNNLSRSQAFIFINCFNQTHHFHLFKIKNTVHISQQLKNQLKTVKTCSLLWLKCEMKMAILSTSHTPHSMYMISYMYWFNIPSMSVTVPVCFTLSSWNPGININTEYNFKSTLILTIIPLKTFLDAC